MNTVKTFLYFIGWVGGGGCIVGGWRWQDNDLGLPQDYFERGLGQPWETLCNVKKSILLYFLV